MRKVFLSLLILTSIYSRAQTFGFDTLKTGQFSAIVASNGQMFHNGSTDSLCKFTQGGEFLRRAGLWLVATENGQIYKSGDHLEQVEQNFSFGPLDTITGQLPENQEGLNRVWKVTKDQVIKHQQKWSDADYQMPEVFESWPVYFQGDFDQYNAAFVDWNQDGIYNPYDGDYPFIEGDEVIYCIANDATREGNTMDGFSFKVEVRAKFWVDYSQPEVLRFEYFIFNRNNNVDFQDVTASIYADGTLGVSDNFATTDLHRNAIILYNDQEDSLFKGDQPAASLVLFENKMTSSMILNNQGSTNSLPANALNFRSLTSGRWTDNTVMRFGGDGVSTGADTRFAFSGSTENNMDAWFEEGHREAGRRHLILSSASQEIKKNTPLKVSGAIIFTIEKDLNEIQKTISSVKSILTVGQTKDKIAVEVFPNPSSNWVKVKVQTVGLSCLEILDVHGRIVYKTSFKEEIVIPCNKLGNNGVYKIRMKVDNQWVYKTLSLIK